MYIEVNGVNVHYHVSGEGRDVLLLHGWGANLQTFAPVHQQLEKHFRVWAIDFPGFGNSDQPPEPWSVGDYADMLKSFIEALNIDEPILIGHSFGGRVSIVYASQHPVRKVILVDSAGIKPKRKPSYYLKVYTYKSIKHLLRIPGLHFFREKILTAVKRKVGSADYRSVSGVMQQTMVKVVNEDLRHHLPNIPVPVLLIWGENDEATPVSDGKIMEKLIPDAGLVILKGAGHYAYLDNLHEFLIIVNHFLQRDKEAHANHD